MGISYCADALTGLLITDSEPVVAIVLDRRRGGYPNAEKAAAKAASDPGHLFLPASLPIRGRMDAYRRLRPDPGQLPVELACAMVGAADWKAFEDGALDFNAGAKYVTDPRHRDLSPEGDEERVFGLAVFKRSSWDLLVRMAATDEWQRASDVAAVRDAIRDVVATAKAAPMDMAWFAHVNLLRVATHHSRYTCTDGTEIELPELAGALDTYAAGGVMAPGFVRWLEGPGGRIGPGLAKVEDGAMPWLGELLGNLWDVRAVRNSLDTLNRVFLPSPSAGQDATPEATFEAALLAMKGSADQMVAEVEDWPDSPKAEMLEGLLERMDGLRGAIAARLAQAKEAPGDAPGP